MSHTYFLDSRWTHLLCYQLLHLLFGSAPCAFCVPACDQHLWKGKRGRSGGAGYWPQPLCFSASPKRFSWNASWWDTGSRGRVEGIIFLIRVNFCIAEEFVRGLLAALDFHFFPFLEAVRFPELWKTQVLTQVFRSARNPWSSKMKLLWLFQGLVCDTPHSGNAPTAPLKLKDEVEGIVPDLPAYNNGLFGQKLVIREITNDFRSRLYYSVTQKGKTTGPLLFQEMWLIPIDLITAGMCVRWG